MKAFVYKGPGQKALEDRPKPIIKESGDANTFMAQNCAGLAGGDVTFQNMQIGSTDCGFGDFDDGIAGLFDDRLWSIFKGFLYWSFINKCFHGDFLFDAMWSMLIQFAQSSKNRNLLRQLA